MSYEITTGGQVRRISDGAVIPADVGNQDYQAYLVWAGQNVPLPENTPELPVEIKRRLAYPSLYEQLEALFDARQGDNTKLAEIDAEIIVVKEQFPKPVEIVAEVQK